MCRDRTAHTRRHGQFKGHFIALGMDRNSHTGTPSYPGCTQEQSLHILDSCAPFILRLFSVAKISLLEGPSTAALINITKKQEESCVCQRESLGLVRVRTSCVTGAERPLVSLPGWLFVRRESGTFPLPGASRSFPWKVGSPSGWLEYVGGM